MVTAGPNSPSAAVQSGVGTGITGWTSPDNVYAADGAFANSGISSSGSSPSRYLLTTGYGFSIPANAIINGIAVDILRLRAGTGECTDDRIRIIKGGAVSSADRANTTANWPTSFTYASYGGSSDLWGETWTPADINNSGFGAAAAAKWVSGTPSARIDHVRITVYYTVNAAPTIGSASVTYANGRSATGPNTTWGVTFTPSDTDAADQGANALSYEVRTGANGTGTLITSGTATHNTAKVLSGLAYSAVASEGGNTVYLRVSDGEAWSADTALTVVRDSVAPAVGAITHSPDPVGNDKQYTLTFTASDGVATGTDAIGYYVYTGAGRTGSLLLSAAATAGVPETTITIGDSALQHGANTRYLVLEDGAGNASETAVTVTADIAVSVDLILQTRVEAELAVDLILETLVGVVPVEVPLILVTRVEPSEARIELHLSGNAGPVGYRLRFEARTKDNQFLRDITDGIDAESGATVELNNDRDIKRTAQFTVDPSRLQFEPLSECLAVYHATLIDGRYWVEYPLGLFRCDEPRKKHRPTDTSWRLDAFDLTRDLVNDMPGTAYVIPAGTNRMAHAAGILDAHGLPHALPVSDITTDKELPYEPGATWLRILNDDLMAAGMYTVWPRGVDAKFVTRLPGDIASRTPDAFYDLLGFIDDGDIDEEPDMNRFANRITVISQTAGLSAVAVNDDPASPVSTVTLGWTKAKDPITADSVTSQAVLDERAQRELREATSQYVRLSLTTRPDPRRDAFEVIRVDGGDRFETANWYVRNWRIDLGEDQTMTWALSRVEAFA